MAIVQVTLEAQEQFHGLPKNIRARVEKLFIRLEEWPEVSGVKRLGGDLTGRYRLRTGDYRVQFIVEPGDVSQDPPTDDVVVVEKVGHRDGFYGE